MTRRRSLGQGRTELGLILALIAIVALVGLVLFGTDTSRVLSTLSRPV